MEAREFRTGNLIYDRDENICTVEMITLGSVLLENGAYFFTENLKPIPLTEEWLVKFGFECKDTVNGGYTIPINYEHQKEFLYCSKNGVVALYNEPKNQDFIIMAGCKHVHQLQNLYFALTGEELEIK